MVWAVSLSTTKLSPRRLTPRVRLAAIHGLVGFGKLAPPSPSSLPTCSRYPWSPFPGCPVQRDQASPWAAPKCISGRTSYLRVRLAFHLYPQLIQQFCNTGRFGPPSRFSGTSLWPWVAHSVSGLIPATCALFRLAFAAAACLQALNLALQSLTRRFILQ